MFERGKEVKLKRQDGSVQAFSDYLMFIDRIFICSVDCLQKQTFLGLDQH